MASLLLLGCQTLDTRIPADWYMKGRVIIRTPDQAERMSIAWRQVDDTSEILLTGPFGASIAKVSNGSGQAVLERPNAPAISADSLDELILQVLGVAIPVRSLATVLSGDRQDLQYQGWQLTVVERDEQDRPRIITVKNSEINIRLTVQSWR